MSLGHSNLSQLRDEEELRTVQQRQRQVEPCSRVLDIPKDPKMAEK